MLMNDACSAALGKGITNCGELCSNKTHALHDKACTAVTDGATYVGNVQLTTNGCNVFIIAAAGESADAFGRKKTLMMAIVR